MSMVGEKDRVAISGTGNLNSAAEKVRGISGVAEASPSDHRIDILATNASSILPQLLSAVTDAGGTITGVDLEEPNLEAVFLHLTGKALRD